MTRAEFVANEELVKDWRNQLESNQTLKFVLEICEDEAPINNPQNYSSETDALLGYGRSQGYSDYAKKLKSLSLFQSNPVDPTKKRSTYQVKKKE